MLRDGTSRYNAPGVPERRGEEHDIATGDWFGDKKAKPKVYYEYVDPKKGKKCKVVKDSLAFDEESGESELKFLVPKVKVTTGKIVFVNKVGEVVLREGFTIGK